MKKIFILLFLFPFLVVFSTQTVYAPPSVNPDWQDYPYCPGGCPHDYLKAEWAKYYDLKGEDWMESKKQELISAMDDGNLESWIDDDPTKANQNVYTYYYTQGEIPNFDGEYFSEISPCNYAHLLEDDDLCSIERDPPCPEPSFRKNGLCVIEKKSLCTLDERFRNVTCGPMDSVGKVKTKLILENQSFGDFDLAAVGNNVFVVWEEFETPDVFIAKSTDGGSNFSSKINISNSQGNPRAPIVRASENYVYVVWYEDTKSGDTRTEDVYIASSADNGTTFSQPVLLSKDNHYNSITSNFDPDITAVGKNVHVVWLSGQQDWFQTFLASSYDGGKTFENKRLSKNDNEMSHDPIIAASSENVYVGWSQRIQPNVFQAKMMIAVSNDNGKSFGNPEDLSPSKTTSHEQTIYAVDKNVFVSWRDEVDKRNVSFVKSSDSGETFSEIKSIAYGARPEIAGKDSIFVAVWCQDDNGLDQICIIKSKDGGGTFLEPIQISNTTWTKSPYAEAPTPKIAVQNETLYISWKYPPEGGGKNNVYLVTSKDGGDTFSDPKIIGDTDEDPKIIVSKDKMYLLWVDDLGQKNNLYFASSSHPYIEEIKCGTGTELKDGVCVVIDMDGPYQSSGDCLIATASFGSSLSPQVQMLREIRDSTLLGTHSGALFMEGFNSVYYSFSPTIAQWENENPAFKEAVKLFITPMIATLSIMTLAEEGSEIQVILYGTATIGLVIGMYVVAPVSLVWKLKKK